MKTEWDYTNLAAAYIKRPEYSPQALEQIYALCGVQAGQKVCDIGAGVAHLTLPLAAHGCLVDAVEPNDAMRTLGQERTAHLNNVTWYEGTGEATGRPSEQYALVSFGSSFNVCDRPKALQESHRLLQAGQYFTCMWNHRDLEDPIQKHIEGIIAQHVPSYGYGTRREDQREIIVGSGLFEAVQEIQGSVVHEQNKEDVVEAWRSHATLHRQAQRHGEQTFTTIIAEIESYLASLQGPSIIIPYTTRAWVARKK